jgi:hypothetical protein
LTTQLADVPELDAPGDTGGAEDDEADSFSHPRFLALPCSLRRSSWGSQEASIVRWTDERVAEPMSWTIGVTI